MSYNNAFMILREVLKDNDSVAFVNLTDVEWQVCHSYTNQKTACSDPHNIIQKKRVTPHNIPP